MVIMSNSGTREVDVIPVAGRNVSGPKILQLGSEIINFRYEITTFPEGDFALVKCQVFQWEYLLFRDAKMVKNPSAGSKGKLTCNRCFCSRLEMLL